MTDTPTNAVWSDATVPDEALVMAAVDGDILAFNEIVKRYQDRLYRFVRRHLQDELTAEEVVQDSFLKLYRSIGRVDTTRRFSTYLFAIAKNEAISAWRRSKHTESIELAEELADDDPIEERLAVKHEGAAVRAAMVHLDPKYRQVLDMYYFQELSYEEMQTKLNIPLNTVRTHLRRAKEALKPHLSHEPS